MTVFQTSSFHSINMHIQNLLNDWLEEQVFLLLAANTWTLQRALSSEGSRVLHVHNTGSGEATVCINDRAALTKTISERCRIDSNNSINAVLVLVF